MFIAAHGLSVIAPSMWDLHSLIRDQTRVPCSGSGLLTSGSPGKSSLVNILKRALWPLRVFCLRPGVTWCSCGAGWQGERCWEGSGVGHLRAKEGAKESEDSSVTPGYWPEHLGRLWFPSLEMVELWLFYTCLQGDPKGIWLVPPDAWSLISASR